LRLLGSLAFFDDLLLRLARHFFVVAEGFRVHASTNLANWVAITNLVLSTGSGQFTDYSMTNCPQRFYRAVVP
jgi:hypothetical protein